MKIFNENMNPCGAGNWRINIFGVKSSVVKSTKSNADGERLYTAEFIDVVRFNLTQEQAVEYLESKYRALNEGLNSFINK